jgi:CheY-like chemotaxis protein
MANRGTAARGRSQRRPDENGRRESLRMTERLPIEAIEAIECGNIHLVLFDIHMPRLDGLGALERVRRALPSLPCILMSAKLDEGILARARQLQAQAVLPKPFSIPELVQTIKNALLR